MPLFDLSSEPAEPNKGGSAPKSADTPKRGPGRPPGSGSAASKKASDVNAALAAMNGLYTAASAGLLLIGRPQTAEYFASQMDQLQAANRTAFESSPKLASVIAGAGQISGVGLFLGTNLMVAVQLAIAIRQEGIMNDAAAQNEAGNG